MTARAACPVCGEPSAAAVSESPNYYRCSSCGVIYRKGIQVLPAQDSWDEAYYSDENVVSFYLKRYSGCRKIVQIMNRLVGRRGNWLDVGCGPGVLLEVAHEQGWEVSGIDPSRICVEVAHKRMNYAQIVHGGVEEKLSEFRGFTVVSLHDVFRSVKQPGMILAGLRKALIEGGWLVIREVNADSQRHERSRDAAGVAMTFSTPLQLWVPQSLENALRSAGFRNVRSIPSPVFTETTATERDGRGWLESRIQMALKQGAWQLSRVAHSLSGGRAFLGPNFITLGQR